LTQSTLVQGMEYDAPTTLERSYSLKLYLSTVWWPTLRGCFMPCQAGPGRSRPWPRYEDLQLCIGPGALQKVIRLEAAAIQDGAARCGSFLDPCLFIILNAYWIPYRFLLLAGRHHRVYTERNLGHAHVAQPRSDRVRGYGLPPLLQYRKRGELQ
jgi:hypothetical protein